MPKVKSLTFDWLRADGSLIVFNLLQLFGCSD